jgi:trehalose synthase
VRVPLQPIERYRDVVDETAFAGWRADVAGAAAALTGRVVWNVNSTARGGGVAEMLATQVGLARDAGIDARWMAIGGTPAFFAITKRVHNHLHGDEGDGGPLGARERDVVAEVLHDNADELAAVVRRGDVVVLHDPQTAGLAPVLRRRGAHVVWRCHIGHDDPGDPLVSTAWDLLLPWVLEADATVFSRAAYVPAALRGGRVAVVRPAIDPFSPKNQDLPEEVVDATLVRAGIVEGRPDGTVCTFRRADGSPARVDRGADILRVGRAPGPEVPLVLQVSRWDRLKDHLGVMRAFAGLEAAHSAGAHLVLAGPSVTGVADDPESPAVLAELTAAWRALPHDARRRVQIATLPMVDPTENAAMVNALQRRAAVVVQKSLREGFGLTVSEAMWKARAVVASAAGGLADQIDDGVDGLLIGDPRDLDAVRRSLVRLLGDDAARARLGAAARARVRDDGMGLRLLAEDLRLQRELVG